MIQQGGKGMSTKPEFKKTLRDKPWDYKTKNEYEDVTVRQQQYVHTHYRHIFDEKRF